MVSTKSWVATHKDIAFIAWVKRAFIIAGLNWTGSNTQHTQVQSNLFHYMGPNWCRTKDWKIKLVDQKKKIKLKYQLVGTNQWMAMHMDYCIDCISDTLPIFSSSFPPFLARKMKANQWKITNLASGYGFGLHIIIRKNSVPTIPQILTNYEWSSCTGKSVKHASES